MSGKRGARNPSIGFGGRSSKLDSVDEDERIILKRMSHE
jgi:hypothetical protein